MAQHPRLCRLMIAAGLATVLAPHRPVAAQSYVARLCETTNCQRLAIIHLPRIESIFLFSNVTPGGVILLKGQGLATTTNLTLRLVDFRGQPKTAPINILETGDTFIGARILPGLIEVLDQQGTLQARTGSNLFSNEFPVNFRADKATRTLAHDDPAVRVISCGQDSNWDVCNTQHDDEDSHPSGFGTGPPLTTIAGGHHNCFACVGTDRGEDTYEIVLRNGWVFESMDWFGVRFVPKGEAWAYQPSFPAGAARWRPTIKWYATSDDTAHYSINVHITGPTGVPWR